MTAYDPSADVETVKDTAGLERLWKRMGLPALDRLAEAARFGEENRSNALRHYEQREQMGEMLVKATAARAEAAEARVAELEREASEYSSMVLHETERRMAAEAANAQLRASLREITSSEDDGTRNVLAQELRSIARAALSAADPEEKA